MTDKKLKSHRVKIDKIDKEIIVRNSKPEESFEALDSKKYILKNNSSSLIAYLLNRIKFLIKFINIKFKS